MEYSLWSVQGLVGLYQSLKIERKKMTLKEKDEILKLQPKKLKWYWWVVIIVVSMMFGASLKGDKVVTKEVVKEVPGQTITKEVTKEADLTQWKALKSKDDEIITSAGRGFIVMSEAITAISNYDVDTMNRKISEMETLSATVTRLGNERKAILSTLGY